MLGAAMGAVVGGQALPGTAEAQIQATPKVLFPVAPTLLPVAGSDQSFPVPPDLLASAGTTPRHRRARWAPTRRASRPSSSRSQPTRCRSCPSAASGDHPYPSLTKNYHYELELVAALKSGGRNIPKERALEHVYGYAVGLDMTRRDLQRGMGEQKKPWEIGKSFDHSAPIGPIHPVEKVGHFDKGKIQLQVNGQVKQDADLSFMIWSVAEQIMNLSEAFELKAGDIIFSGTPENVGPVVKGDVLLGKIDGLPDLSIRIV
ncbi:fumarylacetoacetate hydrolase family protein [Micromonospora sp. STR1s_5]|nr:fumarylacetoacetate hydrolase family protein [Micromonospora sp. STR1s_5]